MSGGIELVRALVVAIVDPDGEDRVGVSRLLDQVSLDDQALSEEVIFARVCMPNAGRQQGVQIFPSLGDEVLLLCDTSSQAYYVLGALHSARVPAYSSPGSDEFVFMVRPSAHDLLLVQSKDPAFQITLKDGPSFSIGSAGSEALHPGAAPNPVRGGTVTLACKRLVLNVEELVLNGRSVGI